MNNLHQLIKTATELHVAHINNADVYSLDEIYSIPLDIADKQLETIVSSLDLCFEEQVILLLALAPYFAPHTLDIFMAKNPNFDVICTEFGGVNKAPHRGVIPTGETAVFLLAARDVEKRKAIAQYLLPDGKLASNRLVELEVIGEGLPFLSGKLLPHEELVQQLFYGEQKPPALSAHFPAQELTTEMQWEDLIIPENTRNQLQDMENWLRYKNDLQTHPELGKRTKKGYRTLFYGPPGTGKTLTATLLGKSSKQPVFRIDLSLMVSKYIGETEKNLAGIFKKAEHKNWILFFDEADALFSKRTETSSSNDRFANQEVSYLLQRIENYNGMVILASNLKQNMDSAFMRRFQSLVYFAMPGKEERQLLWTKTLPQDMPLCASVDMEKLVHHYKLSASQISSVVQSCFVDSMAENQQEISRDTLIKNIQQEFKKEDLLFENML